MRRLFAPGAAEGAQRLVGEAAHYVATVLRLQPGDALELFDGRGGRFAAQIVSAAPGAVELLVGPRLASERGAVHVTLVQALAKSDKLELVVQKATELGVARIVPLLTERSVVRLEGERAAARRERWQRIAEEAARQCNRADVPRVEEVCSWDELLADTSDKAATRDAPAAGAPEARVLLHPDGALRLSAAVSGASRVALLVGPEGGFSDAERERARGAGFLEATLGPRVLRTETVALAALAVVQHLAGELG